MLKIKAHSKESAYTKGAVIGRRAQNRIITDAICARIRALFNVSVNELALTDRLFD